MNKKSYDKTIEKELEDNQIKYKVIKAEEINQEEIRKVTNQPKQNTFKNSKKSVKLTLNKIDKPLKCYIEPIITKNNIANQKNNLKNQVKTDVHTNRNEVVSNSKSTNSKSEESPLQLQSYNQIRKLSYPQAIKVSSTIFSIAISVTSNVPNKIIRGVRIYFSKENTNYLFYPKYNNSNGVMSYMVTDYKNTYTSSGYEFFTLKTDRTYRENACSTKPASGNGEIYLPIGYIYYNSRDYITGVSTDAESSGKCTGKYGRYYVTKSNYSNSPGDFDPQLTNSTYGGVGETPAFYNPNNTILGENLGLATFSGYTKCVEITFQYIGADPRTIALVFYEDT